MQSILEKLSQRVRAAIATVGADGDAMVRAAQEEQFGDYQSNCAMSLAKHLGKNPRAVAAAIVDALLAQPDCLEMCDPPTIAGPGFINFRLQRQFLERSLEALPSGANPGAERLGIEPVARPQTVVVDLSSPNLAKEMHVGHLRSTVIGHCVARVLEFAGHIVHRENHVGDWGTQFGMLVAYLRRAKPEVADDPRSLEISDLESFYIQAKALFDADDAFKTEARDAVVALQRGDPATRTIWRAFCDESLRHCHAIYDRLGVTLVDRGESFYNDLMDEVVLRLERVRLRDAGGLVCESEGALCVFLEGFTTREGAPLPLIVRKSDGGYNYATSDLATILHRVEHLHASRILYVVGIAQKQHFDMLFAAARKVGWVNDDVDLTHVAFGNMLAPTGRPFKTREGGTVKLITLLDEAVDRARRVLDEQGVGEDPRERSFLPDAEKSRIAETVGLAAIIYFDLSHSLGSDYKFDWNTMLSMEGNTAPYMLYAYARIRSIGRKAGVDFDTWSPTVPIVLEHPCEIALAKQLLRFADTLAAVSADLRPNLLTDYHYDLAKAFSRFYDKKLGVRVIDAHPEVLRLSRLRLCDLTARTLRLGLHLLGIATLERM